MDISLLDLGTAHSFFRVLGFNHSIGKSLIFSLVAEPTMDLSAFKRWSGSYCAKSHQDPGSKATGYPRPTATWSFGDKVLEAEGDRVKMKTLSAYAELVISPVNVQTRAFIHWSWKSCKAISGEIDVNVIGKELTFYHIRWFDSTNKYWFKLLMILTEFFSALRVHRKNWNLVI